jgi:hypothetical protein
VGASRAILIAFLVASGATSCVGDAGGCDPVELVRTSLSVAERATSCAQTMEVDGIEYEQWGCSPVRDELLGPIEARGGFYVARSIDGIPPGRALAIRAVGTSGTECGLWGLYAEQKLIDRDQALVDDLARRVKPHPLTLSQRSVLQLRQVVRILPRSSATRVTCEPQDLSLTECLASTLETDRVVLASRHPSPARKYVLGPLILDAADVAQASAERGQTEWTVAVRLTEEATKAFREATEAAAGSSPPRNQIAVIVDGEVVMSPTVVGSIENGTMVISGGFSETQATSLAYSLSPFH